MKALRPFFPFYGSKWNLARHYPAPQYGRIVEPFAGSAGYSTFYWRPGIRVRLFDADPIICGIWNYLCRVTPEEIRALPELLQVGAHTDLPECAHLPQEAKWLMGFWLNRGSSSPAKSRTAYSARTDKAQLVWGARAKTRIIDQLPALAHWSINQGSYETVPPAPGHTYFIDPPYQDKGKYYRIKFQAHQALGRWCQLLPGQVLVCEGAGADWLPFQPLGTFKTSLGKSEERIWLAT